MSAKLCRGVFIHAEGPFYDHGVQAVAAPGARLQGDPPLYPDYDLWRDFPYEYEFDKLAIDVINGSPLLREWVDDAAPRRATSTRSPIPDERAWEEARKRPSSSTDRAAWLTKK
jgi:hypothetical protein